MKEIELKLTINEINSILTALGEMPYKDVALLVNNIQKQATEQLPKKEDTEKESAQ